MQVDTNYELTDLCPLSDFPSDKESAEVFEMSSFLPNSETSINSNRDALSLSESFEPQRDKNNRFRWEAQQKEVFAVVVTTIGLKEARPKLILKYMPEQYQLSAGMIGSHLQKYRKRVMEEYKFSNLQRMQNWMVPSEYESELLKDIEEKWHEQEFAGFSDSEIKRLICEIK